MKILLISPNIKGIYGGVNRIQPPMGLAYLAANLNFKHDVIVYDTAIENWNNTCFLNDKMILIGESSENIEKFISSINPDVVGISVLFSNMIDSAMLIASICKKINPKVIVTIGGNYITNAISDWKVGLFSKLYHPDINYYFQGECDLTFLEFIEKIKIHKESEVSGVCYFKEGNLITNQNYKFIDMTNCISPSWNLFKMEKYFSVGLFHSAQSYSSRVLPVMASRGCPEKCQFCTTPLTWGSSVRWVDPYKLYLEMKGFISFYNIGEIQFQDDTLTANLSKLYQLCDYIKEFNLPWCTPNGIKINYHLSNQHEMFKRMKDSGCYQITLGCESGVQRVLNDIIRKNTKVSQFQPVIQKAKDAGLFVHTFWIVGFPGETYDEMQKTIEVAAGSGADTFSLAIFTPLPGTPLYRKVISENLWWNPNTFIQNSLFRNSLIKVDGFKHPKEYEEWVNSQNIMLNSILEQKDSIRHEIVHKSRGLNVTTEGRKLKQT